MTGPTLDALTWSGTVQRSEVSEEFMRTVFGDAGPAPVSLTYRYLDTPLPAPPVKRRRLTGKTYRAARRAHGRRVRAWKRAGSPMVERMVHVARATLRDVTPVPGGGFSLGYAVESSGRSW